MSSPSEAPGLPQPAEPTGDADFKLRAARYWITVQRPYYARALFACCLLTTGEVETMSIDMQWRIYANPDYLETLSVPETAGLIIHNLNHRLRQHAERSRALSVEARLGNVWHAACDCEIDDDLASDGLTLPEDLLFPYMFDMPNGRTAEQYRQGLIDGGHVREAILTITETGLAETSLPSGGSGVTGAAESYELSSEDLSDTSSNCCATQQRKRYVGMPRPRVEAACPRACSAGPTSSSNPKSTGARRSRPRSAAPCTSVPARRTTRGGVPPGATTRTIRSSGQAQSSRTRPWRWSSTRRGPCPTLSSRRPEQRSSRS